MTPTTTIKVGSTTLTRPFQIEWQTIASDVGSCSFTLLNTDTQRSLLTDGTMVEFLLDGTPIAWFRINDIANTLVDSGEEAKAATKYSGLSAECLLDDAVVYPSTGIHDVDTPIFVGRATSKPYSLERYVGPMDANYDDGLWGSAVEVAPVTGALSPVGWNDPLAMWIGGTAPFYHFRTYITTTGVFAVTIYVAMSDDGEIWMDGVLLCKLNAATDEGTTSKTRKIVVEVTDGVHVIYGFVQRIAATDCLLLCSVYERGTVNVLTRTASDWLQTGDQAGVTVGQFMLTHLNEATARNATDLVANFDAELDSNGKRWPLVIGQLSHRVAEDTLLNVAESLRDGYAEFAVAKNGSAYELSMWIANGVDDLDGDPSSGRGTTTTYEIAAGTNALSLETRRTS